MVVDNNTEDGFLEAAYEDRFTVVGEGEYDSYDDNLALYYYDEESDW